jgi:hypothetical protein
MVVNHVAHSMDSVAHADSNLCQAARGPGKLHALLIARFVVDEIADPLWVGWLQMGLTGRLQVLPATVGRSMASCLERRWQMVKAQG